MARREGARNWLLGHPQFEFAQSNSFVKLIAPLPTGLSRSNYFGTKGRLQGAIAQRIGRFELAIAEPYSSMKSERFRWNCSPNSPGLQSAFTWGAHHPHHGAR